MGKPTALVGLLLGTGSRVVPAAASSTQQRDLRMELSALRPALQNVTVIAPGSNVSQVEWKLQPLPVRPRYLDGFEVLYRILFPASSDWVTKKVAAASFRTRVGPLRRGYKYQFKVRPYGGTLHGRESDTKLLAVPETVPSAAPSAVSITVNHDDNNSIHLNWEPPPSESHNGIIRAYRVWCVESHEQRYQNWTVDRSQHWLDIFSLQAGKRYWITLAAVNGAGVGAPSDPHGFVINPQMRFASESESRSRPGPLHDPVLVGSVGAILWCSLLFAAVCLLRRHLMAGRRGDKGLPRTGSEDTVVNHRVTAPSSPWMSGVWRPGFNTKYPDLWAQGHKPLGMRNLNLPEATTETELSRVDSALPVGTDGCGVYGTFYVDLLGDGLKTFNSPRRYPQTSAGPVQPQGFETIQIFAQPKTSPRTCREMLPWKQSVRPQPKMGVLRESREKNLIKQEVHAVNSVPLDAIRKPIAPSYYVSQHRFSHVPSSQHEYNKYAGCCGLLHHSASLQLTDAATPPYRFDLEEAADVRSVTSDEGSSRSTKLTMDLGSLQSVCDTSVRKGSGLPSRGPPSAASADTSPVEEWDGTLTPRGSVRELPAPEPLPGGWRRARLQSSPSSCCSEWDGSLWNTWSSVTDGSFASARASLISSVDSYSTIASSSFAHFLTLESGASLSDFSPAASPLSGLRPSFGGEMEPAPAWDWGINWMEEMEARYYPASRTKSFNA